MKRKKMVLLIVLLVLIVGAAIFAAAYFITQRVSYDATVKTPGIAGPITIQRSADGTPRIKAHSREDICLALGYLHAQDRFIVLEYFRAIAAGTISQALGEDGTKLEKIVNIAGIRSNAEKIAAELEAPYSNMIKAYARGVNLIRHQWFHNSLSQRDWTAEDVIAILLLREWSHAFLQNQELLFPVPADKMNWVFNELIPGEMLKSYDGNQPGSIKLLLEIRRLLEEHVGPFCEGFAFALPAASSDRELVRSVFSLNSSMNIYPGWYPVKISFGDINIYGITQAGLPFIMAGNSQNISFFGFNLRVDTQDFYTEQTRDFKGIVKYLGKAGWREFITHREPSFDQGEIKRHDIIWHTDNGPLLSNLFGKDPTNEMTITAKFTMPDKSYIASLLQIPFSENIDTALKAVRRVNSQPRVYLFSSSTRAVKTYSGKMPIRPATTRVFRRGPWSGWQGTIDLSAYQVRDIKKTITGSSFLTDAPPALRAYSRSDTGRLQRLEKLIAGQRGAVTDKKLQSILKDVYSPRAEKFIPEFIRLLKPSPVTSARLTRIYFNEWDFKTEKSKVAPAIFERLMYNFILETAEDDLPFLKEQIEENYHLLEDNFYKMVQSKASMFFDDRNTENIESQETIFDMAFLKTMRWLNRNKGPIMNSWIWGEVHRGHYRIPIEEKTLSSRYIYEVNDMPIMGGPGTLFNGSSSKELKPRYNTSMLGILDNRTIKTAVDFAYSVNPMSQFYYGRELSQKFKNYSSLTYEYKTVMIPLVK